MREEDGQCLHIEIIIESESFLYTIREINVGKAARKILSTTLFLHTCICMICQIEINKTLQFVLKYDKKKY